MVLITLFLEKYINDIPVLFCMSIILCGTLEYFTSWILEKLFKARWWDYHNHKFNINGRICLETLIPFGILGTVLLKFANPFILDKASKISPNILKIVLTIIVAIFIIDVIVSYVVVMSFRRTAKEVEEEAVKDNTEEISKKVKEITTAKAKEIKETVIENIEDAKESIEGIPKVINIKIKYMKKKAHFTSKKIMDGFKESNAEFKKRKELSGIKLKNAIYNSKQKVKEHLEHFTKQIKYSIVFRTNKEYTDAVKAKLEKKSWLTKRLSEAFPNLVVISEKLFKNKKD